MVVDIRYTHEKPEQIQNVKLISYGFDDSGNQVIQFNTPDKRYLIALDIIAGIVVFND